MGYRRLIGIREFYKDINEIPSKIKLISLIFIIYGISWGIINPFFPIYLKQNLPNYSLVGVVNLATPLAILVLAAPIGKFADIVGKKKFIIIAILLYLLLGPFYMLSRSATQFIAARIYHGIIWVFLWIPLLGLVRDFSGKKKVLAIGTFLSSYNIGTMFGAFALAPAIVTFFPLQYIFLPLIFTNFLSFLLLLKIPEGVRIKEKFKVKDLYITEIKDFFKHAISKVVAFSAFSLEFAFITVYFVLFLFLRDVGASYVQLALFYGIAVIPRAIQAYFSDLAEKVGKKFILMLGLSICTVSFFLIFFIKDLIFLFAFGIIASVGITMSFPVLEGFVTKIGLRKEGEFTGVLETIVCVGAILGSLIGGLLSDIFYLNFPFLVGAVLCLISILLFKGVKIR